MIPWELLDTAKVPGDAADLRLKRRGAEFSILLGTRELMNSRLSGSEEALAQLSCRKIAGRKHPNVLIGGLGMGFTLRAALKELGPDAKVTVAELVPAVVAWARGPMAELFAGCLDNPRVAIHEGDVGALMRSAAGAWDAIMLDVDNGPEGFTRKENDALYSPAGLQTALRALRPGGVFSVWSATPDDRFAKRLERTGLPVEEVRIKAHRGRSGARHVIWLATKAG